MQGIANLVTGAGGFIGQRLCRALLRQGEQVVAVVRNPKKFRLSHPKLKSITWDLGGPLPALKKLEVDYVFHLAAKISSDPEDDEIMWNSNVVGTLNLIDALKSKKIKRLIYSSTREVYGEQSLPLQEEQQPRPANSYGLTKWVGEKICQTYGTKYWPVTILRYPGVYGREKKGGLVAKLFQAYHEERPVIPVHGDGTQTTDIVWVEDVLRANLYAREKETERFSLYNIAGGKELSIKEIIGTAEKAFKKTIAVQYTGASTRKRFVMHIEKAQKKLDYRPTALIDGLQHEMGFYG